MHYPMIFKFLKGKVLSGKKIEDSPFYAPPLEENR